MLDNFNYILYNRFIFFTKRGYISEYNSSKVQDIAKSEYIVVVSKVVLGLIFIKILELTFIRLINLIINLGVIFSKEEIDNITFFNRLF